MDNKEYNEYMLNLFKECSFKVNENDRFKSLEEKEHETQILYENLASVFNNKIAISFIHAKFINTKYENDLIMKAKNYPYMFWTTKEAKKEILSGLSALELKYKNDLNSYLINFSNKYIECKNKETKEEALNVLTKTLEEKLSFIIVEAKELQKILGNSIDSDLFIKNITNVLKEKIDPSKIHVDLSEKGFYVLNKLIKKYGLKSIVNLDNIDKNNSIKKIKKLELKF